MTPRLSEVLNMLKGTVAHSIFGLTLQAKSLALD